jgi:hypothetical protein
MLPQHFIFTTYLLLYGAGGERTAFNVRHLFMRLF